MKRFSVEVVIRERLGDGNEAVSYPTFEADTIPEVEQGVADAVDQAFAAIAKAKR